MKYRVIGLRDWANSNAFSVPSYQHTGTSFKIEARTANGACASAELIVNATGPEPEPLEYRVPGLADWQLSNRFFVPDYQRRGTDFTVYIQ
ncbi:MAG: hypothetical protein LH609_12975 [Rudanella sp.]|nr:hypothetical protein [Rudanella sp.]